MTEWHEAESIFLLNMSPSGLLCGIRDGRRGQGCKCAPSNKQRSSEGGTGTSWDSRHAAIRKPTLTQAGCLSQVCLQGTRNVFATFWPRALQHSDPGLRSWSLLLVGAYWKGSINNVNWESQLTALTWLSKMRDEPIRGTGGHKSGGSGDRRGILGSSEQRAPQALPYMGEKQDFQAKFLWSQNSCYSDSCLKFHSVSK